ncbi:MAG: hypothetical protein KDA96_00710 [Planctomycetaceae bacterium]|nr:hypothetical protein [Planctomycetaceae bacterium]
MTNHEAASSSMNRINRNSNALIGQSNANRRGFAHPSFVDMLALSFISVMILFMLFVSRNKWEQQAFVVDFLRVEVSVNSARQSGEEVTDSNAGSVSLYLIGPISEREGKRRPVFAFANASNEISLGTDAAYSADQLPDYHIDGLSLRDRAMAFCELSEGVISKTGTWNLLAYYEGPVQPNLSWDVNVLFNQNQSDTRDMVRLQFAASMNPLNTSDGISLTRYNKDDLTPGDSEAFRSVTENATELIAGRKQQVAGRLIWCQFEP